LTERGGDGLVEEGCEGRRGKGREGKSVVSMCVFSHAVTFFFVRPRVSE
jgi:hypothetical protein